MTEDENNEDEDEGGIPYRLPEISITDARVLLGVGTLLALIVLVVLRLYSLVVMMAGWWNTLDAGASIAFRLSEVDRMTPRRSVEFTVRFIRGIFGLALVLTGHFMM